MKFCKWKLNQFKQRTDLKFIKLMKQYKVIIMIMMWNNKSRKLLSKEFNYWWDLDSMLLNEFQTECISQFYLILMKLNLFISNSMYSFHNQMFDIQFKWMIRIFHHNYIIFWYSIYWFYHVFFFIHCINNHIYHITCYFNENDYHQQHYTFHYFLIHYWLNIIIISIII